MILAWFYRKYSPRMIDPDHPFGNTAKHVMFSFKYTQALKRAISYIKTGENEANIPRIAVLYCFVYSQAKNGKYDVRTHGIAKMLFNIRDMYPNEWIRIQRKAKEYYRSGEWVTQLPIEFV